ncbi:hypothetical protein DL767_003478 [Monosporascus sp. MG133]|nr:hypothetical protein DL767_003478 [Monosporascus sp. MG133]
MSASLARSLPPIKKALYANSIIYGPNAYLTKLAILLVTTRAFSVHRKTVRFIYAFIGVMLGYCLLITIIKIRICDPIAGFWNSSIPAACLNDRAIFIVDTIVSVLTDLAVLALPIPLILSTRLPLKKKMKIMLMLGTGGVATAASFIRMVIVLQLQKSNDRVLDIARCYLLGVAEVSIGLICACLPTINMLYLRWKDKRSQMEDPSARSFEIGKLKFLNSRLRTQALVSSREPDEEGLVEGTGGREQHEDKRERQGHCACVQEVASDLYGTNFRAASETATSEGWPLKN